MLSLSSWNVSSSIDFLGMFDNSGVSIENYDSILIGWEQLDLANSKTIGVTGLQYCLGEIARQNI